MLSPREVWVALLEVWALAVQAVLKVNDVAALAALRWHLIPSGHNSYTSERSYGKPALPAPFVAVVWVVRP